jgi:cytochrome c556
MSLKTNWLAIITAALGFVALAGFAVNALAQEKDKIVMDRQDYMKQQGRQLVVVRNYAQGKADQQAARAAIDSLTKTVPNVPNLFPPGTGIGEISVKTHAKPEIWSDHAKFLEADKTVAGQIAELGAAVKSGDTAKAEALVKQIAFCEGCHAAFRAPLN